VVTTTAPDKPTYRTLEGRFRALRQDFAVLMERSAGVVAATQALSADVRRARRRRWENRYEAGISRNEKRLGSGDPFAE
jgi:hypothetical protein